MTILYWLRSAASYDYVHFQGFAFELDFFFLLVETLFTASYKFPEN